MKAKSKIESGEVQLTKSDSWFCGSLYPLLDPSGQHILNVFRVEVEALLESRTLGRRRPLTPPARMPLIRHDSIAFDSLVAAHLDVSETESEASIPPPVRAAGRV